jgi:hypothetical protein
LHELTANAEKSSTTEPLWAGLENCEECGAACRCSLFFQRVFDFTHLSNDDSMILRDRVRMLLQPPEDSLGIDAAIVSNKLGRG